MSDAARVGGGAAVKRGPTKGNQDMAEQVNRVLVIDDDEEDFLIIRDLLLDTGSDGYVLEWVSDVEAARQALRARAHDAFLLDYRLGPADGMTLLREVTQSGEPCAVIMLTGHGSDSVDQAALEAALPELSANVSSFAIAGYFAVRNPAHEQRARDIIRRHSGLPVTCSHELTNQLDGPRRALTCLLNARLIPLIDGLIAATTRFLDERGIKAGFKLSGAPFRPSQP